MNLLNQITGFIRPLVSKFADVDKKKAITITISILVLVIVVIVCFPLEEKEPKKEEALNQLEYVGVDYETSLEERLKKLITELDGAGDCQVMVTLDRGEYKIFAKDSYEEDSGNKYEYVIVEDESKCDSGLIVNVESPEIRGVAVVCEGGDSAIVQTSITKLLASVLGINSTKISVSKMK